MNKTPILNTVIIFSNIVLVGAFLYLGYGVFDYVVLAENPDSLKLLPFLAYGLPLIILASLISSVSWLVRDKKQTVVGQQKNRRLLRVLLSVFILLILILVLHFFVANAY